MKKVVTEQDRIMVLKDISSILVELEHNQFMLELTEREEQWNEKSK